MNTDAVMEMEMFAVRRVPLHACGQLPAWGLHRNPSMSATDECTCLDSLGIRFWVSASRVPL